MQSKTVSALQLAATFILCLGIVLFVFWGGWGLGFFLSILLIEGTFFAWLCLPAARPASLSEPSPADEPGIRASMPLQVFLAAAIVDLGLCYFLYDNPLLKVLDFPILFVLCVIQYLLAARVFRQDWDRPGFWFEAAMSVIVRPFDGLSGFGRTVAGLFSRKLQPQPPAGNRVHIGKVLLGILLAVPVLLFAGTLLSSADAVFAGLFGQIRDWISRLFSNDLPVQLITALVLLPFVFSFLYSGRNNKPVLTVSSTPSAEGFRLDKTVLITFLSCVNLLYLVFAFVQFAYLTQAFQAVLPGDLTYAEYARSGFFELAGISIVNLLLVTVAVKAADRTGLSGRIVRIESLLLVFCSLVQWGSAMFRMKMYIDAYGLSQLRFFVTAFMCLILAMFALVVVKEFRSGFPLFKALAIVALVSLLVLNHTKSDAWIARTNVQHYETTGQIDLEYFHQLSDDAVPAMLRLADVSDADVSGGIAQQLIERYPDPEQPENQTSWQWFNISRNHAENLIEDRMAELKEKAGALD